MQLMIGIFRGMPPVYPGAMNSTRFVSYFVRSAIGPGFGFRPLLDLRQSAVNFELVRTLRTRSFFKNKNAEQKTGDDHHHQDGDGKGKPGAGNFISHMEYLKFMAERQKFLSTHKITFPELEFLRSEIRASNPKKSLQEKYKTFSYDAQKTYRKLVDAGEPEGPEFLEMLQKEPVIVITSDAVRNWRVGMALIIAGIASLLLALGMRSYSRSLEEKMGVPVSMEQFAQVYLPTGEVTSISFFHNDSKGNKVVAWLRQDAMIAGRRIGMPVVLIDYRSGSYDHFVESIREAENNLGIAEGSGVPISYVRVRSGLSGFLLGGLLATTVYWFFIRRSGGFAGAMKQLSAAAEKSGIGGKSKKK